MSFDAHVATSLVSARITAASDSRVQGCARATSVGLAKQNPELVFA